MEDSTRFLREESGFTLLEILVALVLLATTMALVFQLFSVSLRNVSASEDYVSATVEGEMVLRHFLDADNIQEGAFSQVSDNGYTIEAKVAETLKDRSENLQLKVLEIDVAVKWHRGAKEKVLRLRTLRLVDKTLQGGTVAIPGSM